MLFCLSKFNAWVVTADLSVVDVLAVRISVFCFALEKNCNIKAAATCVPTTYMTPVGIF